jgi:hypothetical protein
MDDRGIIGTGWHPVKLGGIHPGTVTMPKSVMKYILSNRRLKKSASGFFDTREAYLVKRRSFPDSDISRFTFRERQGQPF